MGETTQCACGTSRGGLIVTNIRSSLDSSWLNSKKLDSSARIFDCRSDLIWGNSILLFGDRCSILVCSKGTLADSLSRWVHLTKSSSTPLCAISSILYFYLQNAIRVCSGSRLWWQNPSWQLWDRVEINVFGFEKSQFALRITVGRGDNVCCRLSSLVYPLIIGSLVGEPCAFWFSFLLLMLILWFECD